MASSLPQSQQPMQILNIHTPKSSYAVIHSLQQESFPALCAKLARKEGVSADRLSAANHAGGGWIKYEWNGGVWNLDDESDYAIFVWRYTKSDPTPTIHIRDPSIPLPPLPSSSTGTGTEEEKGAAYINPSYYAYKPPPPHSQASATASSSRLTPHPGSPSLKSTGGKSKRSVKSANGATLNPNSKGHKKGKAGSLGAGGKGGGEEQEDMPAHKKEFERFHAENGVRTVIGQIGPVKGVRMLLKEGYRHVYISRIFAAKHGFIPKDAVPGHYGYGGIVHIGKFPITLPPGPTTTTHTLYLTEETHFDVVLGRSFIERRGIMFDSVDLTNVICRVPASGKGRGRDDKEVGEEEVRLAVEIVVLRDGRGEVVTVT